MRKKQPVPQCVDLSQAPAYIARVPARVTGELWQRIESHVRLQRRYLDPSYSALQLCQELGTNSRYLAATIYVYHGYNYAHYINTLRIAHACRLMVLHEYAHCTIEEVALVSGFLSRQNFYKAFVVLHGVTPLAYRKARLSEMQQT